MIKNKLIYIILIIIFILTITLYWLSKNNGYKDLILCNVPNPWVDDTACYMNFRNGPKHLEYCFITRDSKCIATIFYNPHDDDGFFWMVYDPDDIKEIKEENLDSTFESLLTDDNWKVRAGSALLIGYLGRNNSKPLLYKLLNDKTKQVVCNAAITLDEFGEKNMNKYLKLCDYYSKPIGFYRFESKF